MKLTELLRPFFFLLCILSGFSCAEEDDGGSGTTGTLRISLETSAEVLGGSGSSASRVESQAADSPDVNDFALSVTNQGETVYEWSSYKEVAEAGEVELRPSSYTA